MQPFEIWLAQFLWNGCEDPRPWLITKILPDGRINCFPISTKDYDPTAFEVQSTDSDFPATGLRATSYIHDFREYPLPASAFMRRWGVLSGDLLKRFRESAGL